MQAQKPITLIRILKYWGVGLLFTIFISFGISSNFPSDPSGILLWPGLFLTDILGYGGHDIEAYVLILLGDSLFYGLLSFLVLWVWRARASSSTPPRLF